MRREPHPASLAGWTLLITLVVSALITVLAAPPAEAAEHVRRADASADKAARGKYIVNTAGCHDCHTPFKPTAHGAEPDMTRMLSGHPQDLKMPPAPKLPEGPWLIVGAATNTAWSGPWGVSFTANLTPDADTGLGQWTLQDFMNTIRTGRHMGRGREILPPMPIPVYNNLTDADLEAVFAYLRTIPPIRNKVPEPWAPTAAK